MPPGYAHNPKVTSPITIPKHLRMRPIHNGIIVPYFVTWYKDGQQVHEKAPGALPHFPTIDMGRAALCLQRGYCWVCGKMLGTFKTFVTGPAGVIAGLAGEPPMHKECANYAVQVCPFMVHGYDMNTDKPMPGKFAMNVELRNPGLNIVWVCKSFDIQKFDPFTGVMLLKPGPATVVQFWTKGRRATRQEIAERIAQCIEHTNLREHMSAKDIGWAVHELMMHAPPIEDGYGRRT